MDASWWQLILSSLGGGVVVGLFTLGIEELRWRRAHRRWWFDLRRELAVRFLEATDDLLKWATTQGTIAVLERAGSSADIDGVTSSWEAGQKVSEFDVTVRRLNTEIDLVGKSERRAAARLRAAVWEVASANSPASGDDDVARAERESRLHAAVEEHHAAREGFSEAVRQQLLP